MPEERDYKCMCTPGDGNCLLHHPVLEQLCGNDNHAFWEAILPTRCACTCSKCHKETENHWDLFDW